MGPGALSLGVSSSGLTGHCGEGLEGEEVGGRGCGRRYRGQPCPPQTPALFSHIRTPKVLSLSGACTRVSLGLLCTGQLRPSESVSSEGQPPFHD